MSESLNSSDKHSVNSVPDQRASQSRPGAQANAEKSADYLVGHATISKRRLAWQNLRRKPLRTTTLTVVVLILSAVFFGGSMLTSNLNQGLSSLQQRLGADLMIVPAGAKGFTQEILTQGTSKTFYMANDIEDQVKTMGGVQQVTSQTFISTLVADCCSAKVQIIGIEPDSDFVVTPWVGEQVRGQLAGDAVIVGASVAVSPTNTVRLFGYDFPVIAQLARSATGLDNSVFIDRASIPLIADLAADMGHSVVPEGKSPDHLTSALMVRMTPGEPAERVALALNSANVEGVDLIMPGGLTTTMQQGLTSLLKFIHVFVGALWVLALVVLLAVFAASVNERKCEFASLRIIGATRRMLLGLVCREAGMIALIGGGLGVAVAALAVFPFSSLIAAEMQYPYLQAGPMATIGWVALTLVIALATCLLASLAITARLATSQVSKVLREGQ